MARNSLEKEMGRTTIVVPKVLLDRVQTKAVHNGETLTDFISRALVNQLEKEKDFSIRSEVYDEEV